MGKEKRGRRKFLKQTGLATAAALTLPSCGAPKKEPFTPSQRACIIAMAEQIVPRDEYAGATDAGVINYIENWVTKYYPETLEFFQKGAESVQKSSLKLHAKEFQDLDFQTQLELMKKLEKGALPKDCWEIHQGAFFGEILDKTMQGFYGDPRHGGNKDFVSYRMLKMDYPLVIGQNRYEK